MNKIKINQRMSEFQLAQAQKVLVKTILGISHVDNTSRNNIAEFNEKLAQKLEIDMNPNKSLTNLIIDFMKLVKEYESIQVAPMNVSEYPVFSIEDDVEDTIEYESSTEENADTLNID